MSVDLIGPLKLLEPDGSSFTLVFLVGEESRKADVTGFFLNSFSFFEARRENTNLQVETNERWREARVVCVFCLRVWKRLLTSDGSGCELMHHPESCHH